MPLPINFYEMRDEELAEALALHLSDFEFELLLRTRIKQQFEKALALNTDFDESHNYCTFKYDWHDRCEWNVCLGGSYKDRVDMKGEVLTITVSDCHNQWNMQHKNKLSLLLPKY